MSQVTPIAGFVWGFVGTIAMMVVMRLADGDSPPPFAVFWAQYLGSGDPAEAMPQSLVLHFGYGSVAGLVYALAFSRFDLGVAITTVPGGILWGVVWAAVLFVVGAAFWVNLVLGMDPERSQVIQFGVVHLAYGLTLGILSAAVPHLV